MVLFCINSNTMGSTHSVYSTTYEEYKSGPAHRILRGNVSHVKLLDFTCKIRLSDSPP
jgi:hypothetical protein